MSSLERMLNLSYDAHKGQLDKGGNPYILHCIEVMRLLGPCASEELKIIALGHDLLEDTSITTEVLYRNKFSRNIVESIEDISRVWPGKNKKNIDQYKAGLAGNPNAMIVKIADLTHNMDLSRLPKIEEIDLLRFRKYEKLKKFLLDKVSKYMTLYMI